MYKGKSKIIATKHVLGVKNFIKFPTIGFELWATEYYPAASNFEYFHNQKLGHYS